MYESACPHGPAGPKSRSIQLSCSFAAAWARALRRSHCQRPRLRTLLGSKIEQPTQMFHVCVMCWPLASRAACVSVCIYKNIYTDIYTYMCVYIYIRMPYICMPCLCMFRTRLSHVLRLSLDWLMRLLHMTLDRHALCQWLPKVPADQFHKSRPSTMDNT